MKKQHFYAAAVILLWVMALLFLRDLLIALGLPDGSGLEKMAQCVQRRDVTVEEAVSAFCRELVTDGPY